MAEEMAEEMEKQPETDTVTKVVLTAVAGNALITVSKFVGFALTRSPAMLAEAIHSLADTANQLLLFVGIKESKREPSIRYPLGRGQARYVWNLISAMGIFFVGFGATFFHGISSLLNPHSSQDAWAPLPIGILLFAFVLEFYVLVMAYREVNTARKGKSWLSYVKYTDNPTSFAVLMEDGIAVLGVVVALVGIGASHLLQESWPDAVASIIISILLGAMAVILGVLNSRLLMGTSVAKSDEDAIKNMIEAYPSVEKVMSLTSEIMGVGRIRIAAEVEFHGGVLIDREAMVRAAERVRSGQDDIMPVLVNVAKRTVRMVGLEINGLEKHLRSHFPDLWAIDIEVH